MKYRHLFLASLLLMASLVTISCEVNSGNNDDNSNPPNFINDPCSGCPAQENIGNVTGLRLFSYVKNIGGAGSISMTIGTGTNTTGQFDVTAGTSYVFQASVPVRKLMGAAFTYSAKFPGSPGFTDTHSISGYSCTGAPYDLQMNPK